MNTSEYLSQLSENRVIILDGGMGMLAQSWHRPAGKPLSEEDYRGKRFASHTKPLKGCVDLLCLTKPEIIYGIHEAYLESGADIIETCSLNSTAIGLEPYGLEETAYEISKAAAALARKAADMFSSPERRRFAAGSIGPTSKSATITLDPDNPEKRAIAWDELEACYYDNARGLLDGGADIIIIETMFDALNAKAALVALKRLEAERGIDVPAIVSATVSESGRLLTGQTLEAFCASILSLNPWAVGINCSFGAEKLTPYLEAIASAAPCPVIAYPNAGLPDKNGIYSDSPEIMAAQIDTWMEKGLVNIAGGCCGSTPAHIAAIAEKAQNHKPRIPPLVRKEKTILAGTKVMELEKEETAFLKDIHAAPQFLSCLKEGDYESAVETAQAKIANGKEILLFNADTAPNPVSAIRSLIFLSYCFSGSAKLPVCIESSNPQTVEAALKCLHGRGFVKCNGNEEMKQLAIRYGAGY